MAYTRMSDRTAWNDPIVICAYVKNSAAATNVPIYVPYNDVRCVYIYSVVETAIDNTGDAVVTFQFVNAGGTTAFATLTAAQNDGVGSVDEATFSDTDTAALMNEDGYINVNIDGSATGTGALNIFFYFEPIL
jgi:hypothetical protein